MKTKKTYDEIENFINAAGAVLNDKETKSDTKFIYALKKIDKVARNHYKNFVEQVEDINLKHAATDNDGVLLRDERGNFRYKKEDAQKRLNEIRALREKQVEIEPHFADAPSALDELSREPFVGFVLKDEPTKLEVVA